MSLHDGAWERAAIDNRLSRLLPADLVVTRELTARLLRRFAEHRSPRVASLQAFLLDEPLFQPYLRYKVIAGPLVDSPVMGRPSPPMGTLPVRHLATRSDLCKWLGTYDRHLDWLADPWGVQYRVRDHALHHYDYQWNPKRTGGYRLIEQPKPTLKAIQRKIVADILNHVPPHPAAHGFTPGRSIRTFVAPHVGRDTVLRLDLGDFFHSVPLHRISAIFRELGYPPRVAKLLQGLATNAVAPSLAGERFSSLPWTARRKLESKHLPQGAPSSPPIANLCAWRLDCRLIVYSGTQSDAPTR